MGSSPLLAAEWSAGVCAYAYDRDRIWDNIKTHEGWENEVQTDITVEKTDIYRVYEVKPADTLVGTAKQYFRNAGKYPLLQEANKALIEDPNVIQVGWKLKLPNKDA